MNQSLITYLFILLFPIVSCSQKKEKHTPTPPGVNPVQSIVVSDSSTYTTTSLPANIFATSILISSDSIYCYRGADLKNGAFYSLSGKNTYRVFIQKIKREIGDSLTIILKPTEHSSYKTAVDILEEMTINGIKKYSLVKLSDKEKIFLQKEDYNWEPPEPVSVTTPGSVITQKLPENNAIIIELRKDQSVWYTILGAGFDSLRHELKKPITQNLQFVIADFEKRLPGVRKEYLIKGDRDVTYPTFKKVIEALKQNNIYKYNLVTSEE
ncbi:MAG: biopolymer transporter ExbD [Chitinophagaceae bacterium]|nr:biopolymer transporter ExbD [Chitinophagaceae bacterium]